MNNDEDDVGVLITSLLVNDGGNHIVNTCTPILDSGEWCVPNVTGPTTTTTTTRVWSDVSNEEYYY